MKLADRLRECQPGGKFNDKQVDALLTGTRLMLEAVKADLEENESFALQTIEVLAAALAALPADMGVVRNMDQTREICDRKLCGGAGSRGYGP